MLPPSLKRKRHRITTQTTTTTTDHHQQKNSKNKKEDTPQSPHSPNLPRHLLRRLGFGIVGAVYAWAVLTAIMVVAVVLGFGMVTMWAEEPVVFRERVYFNYAEANPVAVMKLVEGVPIGHSFYVRLVMLLPESDYNREMGVFQVVADLISTNGNVIGRTSQPCMLKFRSLPIRLTRTFLMCVPLLIGLKSETQKMIISILRHKEKGYDRTEAIKVTLIPRPGTNFVPQIYEAEIILNSKLSWKKDIVRRWKWTFCIWASLYLYGLLVAVLLFWFRPVIFPRVVEVEREEEREKGHERKEAGEVEREGEEREEREEREVSEMLRRWRRRRSKRKALVSMDEDLSDTMDPSASSISVTREDIILGSSVEDSESICFGG